VDKFDKAIINELRKNARQSISHISEAVNLSRSSVSERIKKLESSDVIKGYQVLLSESQKEGVSAYFEIKHKCSRCSDVIPLFQDIPEVITCRGITGEMDLVVFVKAETMSRIHEIREFIDMQVDIEKIRTNVVMSEWINNGG
jgi:DNA-binding Lrp family transcriptional regulator